MILSRSEVHGSGFAPYQSLLAGLNYPRIMRIPNLTPYAKVAK